MAAHCFHAKFRRCLPALMAAAILPTLMSGAESQPLFSFEDPASAEDWYSVNDGVMGGLSTGRFTRTENASLVFLGQLSLANNGGFASIRSQTASLDLSTSRGLLVRLRGDGRSYYLNLRGPRQGSATSYRAPLPTSGDGVEDVFVPFRDFQLTSYGRTIPGVPLDTGDIRAIGFTIADKKEGPFRLEILSIDAVPGEDSEPRPSLSAESLILLAIERGVPLFNNGSPAGCRAVYELTCEGLLRLSELSPESRQDLRAALRQLPGAADDAERAWVLRYALDRTLQRLQDKERRDP